MKTPKLVVVFCSLVLALPGGGCHKSDAESARSVEGGAGPAPHQILLIGVDGVEWNVVLPMIRAGRLPNLARLMERGAFGELSTIKPTSSPIIWTSVATGKIAAKHGILGFVHDEPDETGIRPLYTSLDRKVKAFWNILTDLGRRVVVIGWWMSYPVEEVNGVMVAQVNTSSPWLNQAGKGIWKGHLEPGLKHQVYPARRQEEILSFLPQVDGELANLLTRVFGVSARSLGPVGQRLWEACTWAFRADAVYRRIALKLLREQRDFDVFAVYFGGSDLAGHRFWRYMQPELFEVKPSEQEIAALGNVIWEYYAYLDGIIGELIALAPKDCVVFILSDHGMAPYNTDGRFAYQDRTRDLLSAAHRQAQPGIFVACGPGIRRTAPGRPPDELRREDIGEIGSIFDVLPTMCHLLRIPLARDMDGGVMRGVLEQDELAAYQAERVETYTPSDWHEKWVKPDISGIDKERLEQLRDLGYIDAPGEKSTPEEYEGPADSDSYEYSG
jgi:predicted AlkP superfamily pyrophosphatase or phosphodiesterase